jgi:transposase InsO family protein
VAGQKSAEQADGRRLRQNDDERLRLVDAQAGARTALQNLAVAFDHYSESHPHSALKYRSPREFRQRANSST